jgi:hypothetical protein
MTKDEEIAQLRIALELGEIRWRKDVERLNALKDQLLAVQVQQLNAYNEYRRRIFKLKNKIAKLKSGER